MRQSTAAEMPRRHCKGRSSNHHRTARDRRAILGRVPLSSPTNSGRRPKTSESARSAPRSTVPGSKSAPGHSHRCTTTAAATALSSGGIAIRATAAGSKEGGHFRTVHRLGSRAQRTSATRDARRWLVERRPAAWRHGNAEGGDFSRQYASRRPQTVRRRGRGRFLPSIRESAPADRPGINARAIRTKPTKGAKLHRRHPNACGDFGRQGRVRSGPTMIIRG